MPDRYPNIAIIAHATMGRRRWSTHAGRAHLPYNPVAERVMDSNARSRAGHHDHAKNPPSCIAAPNQHRRHPRPRRLRRRGRARHEHGRRSAAARGRGGRADAPDEIRPASGAAPRSPRDRRHQQGGPSERAAGARPQRDLRPVPRPRRRERAGRIRDDLHQRAHRRRERGPPPCRKYARAALRGDHRDDPAPDVARMPPHSPVTTTPRRYKGRIAVGRCRVACSARRWRSCVSTTPGSSRPRA